MTRQTTKLSIEIRCPPLPIQNSKFKSRESVQMYLEMVRNQLFLELLLIFCRPASISKKVVSQDSELWQTGTT
jgi:hypothetical protein